MSYYLDIIDTTSSLNQLILKKASANGIVLEWSGGDTKDEINIVASNLIFDMLTLDDTDMAFIDFFTGDEHKFKVLLKTTADDAIVWQGYVLPDLYEEPYKNVNFFVKFTATDGLGRLKGKYLPEQYYSGEKSLIDIFCQILRLTGLEMELFFAPAIENFVNKDWNTIYIDTESFIDNKKKKDAYSIFETLLKDTLCVCYQCDNRWYIEGLNIRQLRKVTYKKYDTVGTLLGTVVYDRVLKQITALVTPTITMIPPYNEIIIKHKRTVPKIPKTASKEKNDGWVVTTGGADGAIDCSEWIGNGNYFAKAVTPDYDVAIYNQFFFDNNPNTNYAQDNTKFISLRKKLFLSKSDKVKFTLDFKIIHPKTGNQGSVSSWNNCFKYEIRFNSNVLYSNFGTPVSENEDLIFNDSAEAKIQIEHLFSADSPDGLLDIRLYRPTGRVTDNGVLGVALKEISVEILNFVEEITETDLINGDFTIDKEIDLEYAEDKSGFSKGFRLEKLKEQTVYYNDIECYINGSVQFESNNYAVVNIEGANLIKENPYQVSYLGVPIEILDVIYNFGNGNQMLVQTIALINSGFFVVRKFATDDVLSDRSHWLKWSDAFYKIENNSYAKTVANIYRRMFNVAHEKLDCAALNAVKFNDLVQFHYVFMKDFVVLNCSWNLDENKTTLTLGRANYKDTEGNIEGENLPPIVVANDDVYIPEGAFNGIALGASAYDPDGFIASQQWTKIAGDDDIVFSSTNQLNTTVSNLRGDYYTFQIQVTDNDGATAVDTVNVIRIKNYVVSLELVYSQEYDLPYKDYPWPIVLVEPGYYIKSERYKIVVSPELPDNIFLGLKGKMKLYARGGRYSIFPYKNIKSTSSYSIEQNTHFIEGNTIEDNLRGFGGNELDVSLNLTYFKGDVIFFTLTTKKGPDNKISESRSFEAKAVVEIDSFILSENLGNTNLIPLKKEVRIFD